MLAALLLFGLQVRFQFPYLIYFRHVTSCAQFITQLSFSDISMIVSPLALQYSHRDIRFSFGGAVTKGGGIIPSCAVSISNVGRPATVTQEVTKPWHKIVINHIRMRYYTFPLIDRTKLFPVRYTSTFTIPVSFTITTCGYAFYLIHLNICCDCEHSRRCVSYNGFKAK